MKIPKVAQPEQKLHPGQGSASKERQCALLSEKKVSTSLYVKSSLTGFTEKGVGHMSLWGRDLCC